MALKWLGVVVAAGLVTAGSVSVQRSAIALNADDSCRCCKNDSYSTLYYHYFMTEGDDPCVGEVLVNDADVLLSMLSVSTGYQISPSEQGDRETPATFSSDVDNGFEPLGAAPPAFLKRVGGGEEEGCSNGGSCRKEASSDLAPFYTAPYDGTNHNTFHGIVSEPSFCGSHESCAEQEELSEALEAVDAADYASLAGLHLDHPQLIRINEGRALLQIHDCIGKITAQLRIDVAQIRHALAQAKKQHPVLMRHSQSFR